MKSDELRKVAESIKTYTLGGLSWNFDPAASGPRLRAFVGGPVKDPNLDITELKAYVDGAWGVETPVIVIASGVEPDLVSAQKRAIKVWKALTEPIK